MAIEREIFINPFYPFNVPDWSCPTCHKGVLKSESKSIKTYESATSSSYRNHEAWEPEWINGVFLGLLKCSNPSCNETVVVTGEFYTREDREYDDVTDTYDMVLEQLLTPTCINPPLHIFQLKKNIPETIVNEILNAFNIYWLDVSSCANKIRVVVELIMDDKKIAKAYNQSGKRKGYSLHKRIEIFKAKNPTQAESLMAIKWIGNSGSHTSENLTKDDILDGFEILEHVLNKLYDKDSVRIAKLTKTINKRKKPIGQTNTRRRKKAH